ncbi:MAG: LytR C-terminal domain-containing protein [Gaiellaceae bacterium]
MIELARPLELNSASPLEAARLRRKLTIDEAARRAGLTPDEVQWLEEGRVYRFPSTDEALAAALLLVSALGIDHREARRLSGRSSGLNPFRPSSRRRLLVLAAIAASLAALAAFVVLPGRSESAQASAPLAANIQQPTPWKISVDVLNGSGDINHTRQVASRIGALAYTIKHVGRADRFDYTQTAVFYERGGEANAVRLARKLGVVAKPLPGGKNPRRLVVVVGPAKGPGQ